MTRILGHESTTTTATKEATKWTPRSWTGRLEMRNDIEPQVEMNDGGLVSHLVFLAGKFSEAKSSRVTATYALDGRNETKHRYIQKL